MTRVRLVGALMGCIFALATPALAGSCEALQALALPDVAVTAVTDLEKPVPHCKVEGRIGRRIGFAVWLPETWNGRFAMGGQGGFAGTIDNQAQTLGGVLRAGYATAATDTGHQAQGLDGRWALDDLEAIVDYGHVAVHRVSEVAKAIVRERYQKPAEASFFLGCSNGGRQALMEAQRYPTDFDVILAGAPALDFDGLAAAFLYITQRIYPDMDELARPVLTREDRRRLREAIVARCDAGDGIEDGVLADPTSCDFDPTSLACDGEESGHCFGPAKIEAVRAIYEGPRTASGERLHVGFPFGAEDIDLNGWGSWLVGRENGGGRGVPSFAFAFGLGLARYFVYHDPEWSYEGYDFSTWERDSKPIQATLNADDPDLDAFREHGGKLLLFHGWADAALSPHATIDYVRAVYERDEAARDDVRLFLMPGVLHCFGGRGPSRVDWLGALERWYEGGEAPAELEVGFGADDGGRKLCSWPQKAVFVGTDARRPDAFECR